MADQATDTASAALRKVLESLIDKWHEQGTTKARSDYDHGWVDAKNQCATDATLKLLASLPAPAAPVIVVQVPDGWRVAQWDGQRYVSIGLPYPTERQANGDCALILARVQPAIESRSS